MRWGWASAKAMEWVRGKESASGLGSGSVSLRQPAESSVVMEADLLPQREETTEVESP